MTDQEFKDGLSAAIKAYYDSLNGSFPVAELSFTFTPAPAAPAPVAETVIVTL